MKKMKDIEKKICTARNMKLHPCPACAHKKSLLLQAFY